MGKLLESLKKTVGKPTKVEKKEVKEVKKKEVTCESCNGKGLLDADNLCVVCDGSGKVTS